MNQYSQLKAMPHIPMQHKYNVIFSAAQHCQLSAAIKLYGFVCKKGLPILTSLLP